MMGGWMDVLFRLVCGWWSVCLSVDIDFYKFICMFSTYVCIFLPFCIATMCVCVCVCVQFPLQLQLQRITHHPHGNITQVVLWTKVMAAINEMVIPGTATSQICFHWQGKNVQTVCSQHPAQHWGHCHQRWSEPWTQLKELSPSIPILSPHPRLNPFTPHE